MTAIRPRAGIGGGVGESAPRIDALPKVKGEFEYASDLRREGMLWGETLRSPHPSARIRSIDVSRAAIRWIVFEAAVLGRVVRRCDQNAIGKALRPGAIVHQHSP